MKSRFIMLFLAATALLFSACNDDEKNNSGNGSSADQLENNTLVYDGVTYKMIPFAEIYHGQLTLVTAFSEDTNANGESKVIFDHFHIRNNEEFNMWNSTIDFNALKEHEDYEINIMGDILTLSAWGSNQYAGGIIDDKEYDSESVFTKGTQKVIGNNDRTPFTVIIDAVLKNGKSLQIKLYVPAENQH